MSDKRFTVIYHLTDTQASSALAKAKVICLEQTVEVNDELVPNGFIREHVIGQLEHFAPLTPSGYEVHISYAVETTAFELTQLLNVIFGNSSIKPGIKVHRLQLNANILTHFPGSRFGINGLREIVKVFKQPLLCTALKPMGKSALELADLAYQMALGGIDIIKDDHGLSNQPFCPFEERVIACAEAVAKANRQTGKSCIYVPNITASCGEIMSRAYFAKRHGAGGLLIAPGLTGFDALRTLAADVNLNLPLISHPALLGSFVLDSAYGFSHAVLFGQLQRLAGADASIYPNYGGRFGFTREECQSIAMSCHEPLGNLPTIFPTPGGGMTLEKIPDMITVYGREVIFLIGGALYSHSPDLLVNAQHFLTLVGR